MEEKERIDVLRKIEECLDNGIDVNVRDERGATALVYVKILLRHGHYLLACQIAKLLLDGGADVDVEDEHARVRAPVEGERERLNSARGRRRWGDGALPGCVGGDGALRGARRAVARRGAP